MRLDDDELVPEEEFTEPKLQSPMTNEKTQLAVSYQKNVPLEATPFTVLIELQSRSWTDDNFPVDIVAVLDVSWSMRYDNKLAKMQKAMKFLMDKLCPKHRLSVVTFSKNAIRMCPLRHMTRKARKEVEELVNDLSAHGSPNMAAGLRLALRVLDKRKKSHGRISAIILMSDGYQDERWDDATKVIVNKFPIYTFAFERTKSCDPHQVLITIANHSSGGTFEVLNVDTAKSTNNLNHAFQMCLGGLLGVAVENVELTIRRANNTIIINDLSETCYLVKHDADSQTISFGDLYLGEKRNVLVDLHLPQALEEDDYYETLEIYRSYEYCGKQYNVYPVLVGVNRSKGPVDEENKKVAIEKNRVTTFGKMQKETDLADNNFSQAQNELQKQEGLFEKATFYEKGNHIPLTYLKSHCDNYHNRKAAISNDLNSLSLLRTLGAPLNPDKPVVSKLLAQPESTVIELFSGNITKTVGVLQTLVVSLQEILADLNSITKAQV